MKPDRFARVKRLLLEVADLSEAEREAYLDEACRDDPELRSEVESILTNADRQPEALQTDSLVQRASGGLIGKTVSHYRILERLGAGGMGVVYKAEDTALNRTVALKFLPAELTRDARAKARFLREAQAEAALDHPNVCSVHEIGETEGLTFIAMTYVEGRSLRERMEAEPLRVDEAVDIAVQIAEGLREAHGRGIVHRDIKPANIMFTDKGRAKIMDFGLAKLAGHTEITTTGTRMGTVAYMSPEQARGEEVDHRTDIWSLGAVVHEMITGVRPFRGDSEQAVLYLILNEDPKPLSDLRPDASAELQRVMDRAMAKDLDERYQSVAEMVGDLRRVREGLRAGIGVEIPAGLATRPSIAVLPFVNMTGDPDDEYFSDGLAEDLINSLSHIRDLRVVARTSSFSFKGKDTDVRRIGRKLRVGTLLEGSVRRSGDRLRITAQLVNASDGCHLWSERYDRRMEDVFAIQDEISTAITDRLRVRLLEEERPRAVKRHTGNMEAYRLYMKGRYCFLRDRYQDAIAYYEQALARDPGYPLPYVGVADVLSTLSYYGYLAPKDAFPKAKAASKRALEIDDGIGEAYSALGFISLMYDYDWDEAKRLLERGRELNPNHEYARLWYVTYLWAMGLTELAKQEVRLTLESNPVSLLANLYMGYAFQWARECDEAEVEFRKLMEMDPDYLMARVWLGHTYIVAGKYNEAVATLEPAAAATEDSTYNWGSLGWAYGLAGRRKDALEVLARLEEMSKHRYVRHTHRAFVYLGLREYDQAIALLEKGREEREADLAFLSTPLLDPCRSHPKFVELVRRMGLEDRGIAGKTTGD